MDRGEFCRQSRVLVVAGKGGVGKTTVTAALARMAADAGLDVLVVGLDDAGALPVLFGADVTFGYDEVLLYSAAGGGAEGSRAAGGSRAAADAAGAPGGSGAAGTSAAGAAAGPDAAGGAAAGPGAAGSGTAGAAGGSVAAGVAGDGPGTADAAGGSVAAGVAGDGPGTADAAGGSVAAGVAGDSDSAGGTGAAAGAGAADAADGSGAGAGGAGAATDAAADAGGAAGGSGATGGSDVAGGAKGAGGVGAAAVAAAAAGSMAASAAGGAGGSGAAAGAGVGASSAPGGSGAAGAAGSLVAGAAGAGSAAAGTGSGAAGTADVAGAAGSGSAGAAEGLRAGRVQGRVITPDDALLEYLMDHGLRRVAKRLVSTGVLDVVSTAIPGIREILVLGKVKQLERAGTPDLLLLDAPATGHAVRFLTSANGLMDAARGGPLRTQAADVVEMMHDPDRLQVLLVTLPEETPVNELVETAFRLEDEVGVTLGPVVVNACYPPVAGVGIGWIADPLELALAAGEPAMEGSEAGALRGAAGFRASREAVQLEQIDRLSADMPLPQLRLPYVFSEDIGPEEVAELAEALGRAIDELDADELTATTAAPADLPVAGDVAPDEAVSRAGDGGPRGAVSHADDGGSDDVVSPAGDSGSDDALSLEGDGGPDEAVSS